MTLYKRIDKYYKTCIATLLIKNKHEMNILKRDINNDLWLRPEFPGTLEEKIIYIGNVARRRGFVVGIDDSIEKDANVVCNLYIGHASNCGGDDLKIKNYYIEITSDGNLENLNIPRYIISLKSRKE